MLTTQRNLLHKTRPIAPMSTGSYYE